VDLEGWTTDGARIPPIDIFAHEVEVYVGHLSNLEVRVTQW
jgi:hypothetical protein